MEGKFMSKEKILSASRIKNLENCSYKYWCDYHLSLPSSQNSGAARGTVCHLILECLLEPRHRHYIKTLLKAGTIESVPSIVALVKKALKKEGSNEEFFNDENYKLCDEMILVGLNCDFLGGKGAEINYPEKEFLIESESPKYKIRGFIDKPIEYKGKKKLRIVDYKTSKNKFVKGEVDYNVQAMAYLLAAKTEWPELKEAYVEFQFLKYPKDPLQEIRCSDDQLKGFESYLEYVYTLINNYSEENAHSNFAANQPYAKEDDGFKGPISCGYAKHPGHIKPSTGLPYWVCEYKWAYDYYVLLNEDGKVLKSTKDKAELDGLEGSVEKRRYDGCPAHPQEHGGGKGSAKANVKDDFDF